MYPLRVCVDGSLGGMDVICFESEEKRRLVGGAVRMRGGESCQKEADAFRIRIEEQIGYRSCDHKRREGETKACLLRSSGIMLLRGRNVETFANDTQTGIIEQLRECTPTLSTICERKEIEVIK